jgi:hypothetical protein
MAAPPANRYVQLDDELDALALELLTLSRHIHDIRRLKLRGMGTESEVGRPALREATRLRYRQLDSNATRVLHAAIALIVRVRLDGERRGLLEHFSVDSFEDEVSCYCEEIHALVDRERMRHTFTRGDRVRDV